MYQRIVVLLFVVLTSCITEEPKFTIPYAPVRFSVDLNGVDSDMYPLSYKIFTRPRAINENVGYGGLLIFRNHENKIFAYDLCCPHEDDKNIRVKMVDNISAQCEVCGSLFEVMSGLGIKQSGVSSENLQRYRVDTSRRTGAYMIRNL